MNSVLVEKKFTAGLFLQIVQGDITVEEVDAIVNAANEQLAHGGGVAWAISKKGGPKIQEESDAWIRKHGPVSHAHPAWTSGGHLPAKYVIHAVGPVWGDGDGAALGGTSSSSSSKMPATMRRGCRSCRSRRASLASLKSTPAESARSRRALLAIARTLRIILAASEAARGKRSGPKISSPRTARIRISPNPISNTPLEYAAPATRRAGSRGSRGSHERSRRARPRQ